MRVWHYVREMSGVGRPSEFTSYRLFLVGVKAEYLMCVCVGAIWMISGSMLRITSRMVMRGVGLRKGRIFVRINRSRRRKRRILRFFRLEVDRWDVWLSLRD
jgi:hypothetical protein